MPLAAQKSAQDRSVQEVEQVSRNSVCIDCISHELISLVSSILIDP